VFQKRNRWLWEPPPKKVRHAKGSYGAYIKEKKMAKFVKFSFLYVFVLIIGFSFLGCVGSINYRKIDLTTNNRSSQILNLRNYGDKDLDVLRQSEKLMKNGFLDTRGEEYGYYQIAYSHDSSWHGGWAFFHAFTFGISSLIGVPTDSEDYTLTAILKIYDSNGILVKDYRKTESFTQTAGLYYGHNPTKRAEREFIKLFSELQQTASMQSGEINQALLAAGPVTRDKEALRMAAANEPASSNSSTTQTQYVPVQQASQSLTKTYYVYITYEMPNPVNPSFGLRMGLPYTVEAMSAADARAIAIGRWQSTNRNNKFIDASVSGGY
jgi:hypothetical protein